jgi:hypothetical protein
MVAIEIDDRSCIEREPFVKVERFRVAPVMKEGRSGTNPTNPKSKSNLQSELHRNHVVATEIVSRKSERAASVFERSI